MKDQEEMPQGWRRIGNLLYTLEEDGRYRGKMMYRNRLTVSINGFRSVEETEVGELTERLYTFLATPATLPPFYKEGDAAAGRFAPLIAKLIELVQDMRTVKLDDFKTANSQILALQGGVAAFCATWDKTLPFLRAQAATPAPVLSLVEEAGPQGWISVEERLPVPLRKVLLLIAPELHGHDAIEIGYFVQYGDGDGVARGHWSTWEALHFADVVGWQELPFAMLSDAPTTPSKEADQKGEEVGRG